MSICRNNNKLRGGYRKGVVLILSMIFIVVFSSLAYAIFSMSGSNVQIADDHRKADIAFANAESGLAVLRYWTSDLRVPTPATPSDFFTDFISTIQAELTANSITNLIIDGNGDSQPVALDALADNVFVADMYMHPDDPNIFFLNISGQYDEFQRTIQVSYNVEPYIYPIFKYGMATKGPVLFDGNPTVTGVNSNDEADIYIESQGDPTALHVTGNTNFDGDITVGNAASNVAFDGDVQIAGDHGQTALDNHVTIGEDPVEFPVPDTEHFRQYATGPVIDSTTNTSAPGMTLTNALIQAGADPNFTGNVTIEGVLFIEAPNIVLFQSNVVLEGMIIGNGDPYNPGTNRISFYGNFASGPFPSDSEFDVMRSEQGSSFLAPGFLVEFAGNFASLAGVFASTGLVISGNCAALVEGTIINYSDSPTIVYGNASLNFDRSNQPDVPAGFDNYRFLDYTASSWTEIH